MVMPKKAYVFNDYDGFCTASIVNGQAEIQRISLEDETSVARMVYKEVGIKDKDCYIFSVPPEDIHLRIDLYGHLEIPHPLSSSRVRRFRNSLAQLKRY